ncbi:MAG: DUF364 domain-containing protein [Firmicutes bacterium]|nr:DUF364 domain-containing protein [Bacillota bacterium]
MIKKELHEHLVELTDNNLRVKQIVINPGFTGVVLDSGDMGIAMNVRSGHNVTEKINDYLQGKTDVKALTAAEGILKNIDIFNDSPEEKHLIRSVLVALYNALSRPFMDKEHLSSIGCKIKHGTSNTQESSSAGVKAGETLTIVGFGGMVRSLSQIAKRTYVTELKPEFFRATSISSEGIVRGSGSYTLVSAAEGEKYFKKADTIYVTGCTLVTDTMDEILRQCRGKKIIVYGATASFLPQPLLERDVNTIQTTIVRDADLMAELLLNCAGAVERFFPMACENVLIVKDTE